MDAETTLFQSGDITVTNSRFIVGAQTFAMRGITSVQAVKTPASYGGAFMLMFIGLIFAFIGFASSEFVFFVLGVMLLALGIWVATRQRPVFAVVLRTAGGEVTAYRSFDGNCISQIIEALNQSIITRG